MKHLFQVLIIVLFFIAGSFLSVNSVVAEQGSLRQPGPDPTDLPVSNAPLPYSASAQPIFLPIIVGRGTGFSISGRVVDVNNRPLSDVVITDSSGVSAWTDANGNYVLDGLLGGEHALAPASRGYVFTPSILSFTVPPGKSGLDFKAMTACTDVVVNGSFEDGDAPWVFPVTPYPADRVNTHAHNGAQSARTGIVNPVDNVLSYSSVQQLLIIPDNIDRATLRVWLYPQSGETRTLALPKQPIGANFGEKEMATDVQYLVILDQFNNVLDSLLWMRSDQQDWGLHVFDLTRYAGDKIKVHVGTYNDGVGGVTGMYVDDVSLEVCPSSEPTQTPVPTSTGVPPGCENQVENSGFENDRAWEIPNTEYDAGYVSGISYGGSRSMRTGILKTAENRFSYSDAGQWVTVPKNSTIVKLRLWLYPLSEEVSNRTVLSLPKPALGSLPELLAPSSDVQYVLILDQYNQIIDIPIWQLSNSQRWEYYEFSLRKFAGQTIKVQFGTFNTGGGKGVSAMYVDDVTLDTCPSGSVPTPTPTATRTPTPTATLPPGATQTPTATIPPPDCSEGITNNSFEQDSDWIIPVTEFSAGYSTAQAHSGARSMRTGIIYTAHNRYSYSDAAQVITISSLANDIELRLWLYASSGEAVTLGLPEIPKERTFGVAYLANDVQYVILLDRFGNWIDTLLWQRNNAQKWQLHTFDLSNYSGSTIRVQFGTYNNGAGGVTAMYVDDASLQVCR
ncbi:MAG: hypothetical protein A2Z16_15920 [Chloroflexi bacterium RBG_16_54_18]|nr:MAG: hypothetical protein A2Z16_15920 [Chloroflexi bacterium RBG_16_54_18]